VRRAILWVLKLIFARLVWNRVVGRLRQRATRIFSVRNLFGESVATWLQMRRLK
jgi:hypothetical protein